jgi:hypothetical protein
MEKRTNLIEVERTPTNVVYYMYANIEGLNMYQRAKVINRFLTTESKIMERVIESDLRHFLRVYSIIPQTMSESALKQAFDTLKGKGKDIEVIDRYKNVREKIVGVSNNQMTIIEDDQTISLSMEVRVVDYEETKKKSLLGNNT